MSQSVDPSDWESLDTWWTEYIGAETIVLRDASVPVINDERLAQNWDDIDPWWEIYIETGNETAVQLAEQLNRSNERWTNSGNPFDLDPLAADLTGKLYSRGPLQPSDEVNWSRWLAQLLAPSGALVSKLFGLSVEHPPDEVIREDRLLKRDGGFRRPDILVLYADFGISIEVKLDDEHYEKTAETARLVEQYYDGREWIHTILLPKSNIDRLESNVEPAITLGDDGQRQIEWSDPGPIEVKFWEDVTAGIRSVMLHDEIVDDHWAANAYLFCAVAEQQLMNFQPQSTIEQMAAPNSVVDTVQPIRIAQTLEEQLIYFRESLRS